MMKAAVTIALMLTAMAWWVPAAAQETPRFSVSFDFGAAQALSGDLHGAGAGTVLELPTRVEARGYDEIYDRPTHWALSVGARLAAGTEIRGRYYRSSGDATQVQVGDVAALPLFAEFDGYLANGVDLGIRQYFGTRVQPYVGASGGLVRVDRIDATFSVPAAGVVLTDVPMFDRSTVPTIALSAGVLVPITPALGIQGGVDVRWVDDLDPVDGLAGTGLDPINDRSDRWSMPFTAGVVLRF